MCLHLKGFQHHVSPSTESVELAHIYGIIVTPYVVGVRDLQVIITIIMHRSREGEGAIALVLMIF